MDNDYRDFPVILGMGACHTLTDHAPAPTKRKGKVKESKRHPIGFHVPRNEPAPR